MDHCENHLLTSYPVIDLHLHKFPWWYWKKNFETLETLLTFTSSELIFFLPSHHVKTSPRNEIFSMCKKFSYHAQMMQLDVEKRGKLLAGKKLLRTLNSKYFSQISMQKSLNLLRITSSFTLNMRNRKKKFPSLKFVFYLIRWNLNRWWIMGDLLFSILLILSKTSQQSENETKIWSTFFLVLDSRLSVGCVVKKRGWRHEKKVEEHE